MDFPQVVGCGPAGSLFAYAFGERSVIYEEHDEIGYPVRCAGLISEKAYRFFRRIGIDISECIENKINEAEINLYGKKHYMSLRAILLDRGRFDRVLAEYAEGNAKIIKRRIKEENLKEMKAIIGADGPLSTVARAFDFDDLSYAIAYQRELIGNKEFENVIKVYFFRNSFGYVIPNFRRKIVGIVFFKGPKRDFAERFFNSVRGENEREIENFSAVIPIKMRKEISKRLGERRIHLTGDAAGIVKSTSGGGIYYGCLYSYYLGKYFYDEEKLKKAELDIRRRLRLHELLRGVLNKNLFLKLLSLFPRLRISYDMEDVHSVDFEKLFNSFSLSFHEEKNRI